MKSVYDQLTYILPLSKEIKGAKVYIGYFTPYLSETAIDIWEPDLLDAIARGVRVCIFVEMPEKWGEKYLERHVAKSHDWLRTNMKRLEDMGAHVNMVRNFHPKVLIIDFIVVWSGSINFLSSNPYKRFEKVDRDDDWVAVVTAYFRLNFECCERCEEVEWKKIRGAKVIDVQSLEVLRQVGEEITAQMPSDRSENQVSKIESSTIDVDEEPVGQWIGAIRQLMNVSISEISRRTNLSRNAIHALELGKAIPTLKLLIQVLKVLGYELMIVPSHTVSLHRRIAKSYAKSDIAKDISKKQKRPRAS